MLIAVLMILSNMVPMWEVLVVLWRSKAEGPRRSVVLVRVRRDPFWPKALSLLLLPPHCITPVTAHPCGHSRPAARHRHPPVAVRQPVSVRSRRHAPRMTSSRVRVLALYRVMLRTARTWSGGAEEATYIR